MAAAVRREVLAVRRGVGLLDASTLGKIDIQGPDAATLLNRVYTNGWSQLAIGRARYGLMLDENGMVFDDGVTVRLGEQHYLMHTTTGGAARVLAWLERWLQTEWPDLDVYLTTVTDHWATIAVAGPDSRLLLRRVCADVDFDDAAFPFMSYRPGTVAGVGARLLRVSFSGERSYEVSVPAADALQVWQALTEAGADLDVTPYGTETMHVLRAEKGFIIVGQDTDGSVSPVDLGMAGLVSKTKDFLGRRSLVRSDTARTDRKQFVGLLTDDPAVVLAEGAQILNEVPARLPAPMVGHVTSSYASPTLGRSIALALVRGGHARHGETVWVSAGGAPPRRAVITSAVFYDPDGERQQATSTREADEQAATAGASASWPVAGHVPVEGVVSEVRMPTRTQSRMQTQVQMQGRTEAPQSTTPAVPGANRLQARWLRDLTVLNLRGDSDDGRFAAAVRHAFGISLPARACSTTVSGDRRIVWAGPDDWFLIAPGDERAPSMRALQDSLAGVRHALTDVGSGYAVLTLGGGPEREILAHGCPLDLHPAAFGPDSCAGTHFFKAQIRLWQSEASPAFDLLVRTSFAGYVDRMLELCTAECGLTMS
jgi:heterotetrameric sarcosine oxidase gamma subunit